jgi:hypothetical protein
MEDVEDGEEDSDDSGNEDMEVDEEGNRWERG